MQTKFILHGGFEKGKQDEDNSLFYGEILKNTKDFLKILLVLFAKDDDRIEIAGERITKEFQNVAGDKKLVFTTASLESFLSQLASADVVYFAGGGKYQAS